VFGDQWPRGDGDGLPQDGQSEREAAIDAAQRLVAGPYICVPRSTWHAVLALMREAVRLLECVLDEAGGRQADDERARE
jgi:hypothetical protein